MTRGFLLGLFLAASACADDLAARLDREIARLASDDPRERDAAVEAIAKEGRAAEPGVKARLAEEKDAEVRGRLQRALQRIDILELGAKKWTALWSARPFTDEPDEWTLSADGRLAATAGADGRLVVWDAATGKPLVEIRGLEPGPWASLGFTADASQVAWIEGHEAPQMLRWRTNDGAALAPVGAKELGKDALAFRAEDGVSLVALRTDACGYLGFGAWLHGPGGVVALTRPIEWAALSPDGERLAIADRAVEDGEEPSGPREVRVWSLGTGEKLRSVALDCDGNTGGVRVAPDASRAASIDKGSVTVAALDGKGGLVSFGTGVVALAWAGTEIVTAHDDGSVRWWADGVEKRSARVSGAPARELIPAGGVLCVRHRSPTGKDWDGDSTVLRADTGETLLAVENGSPIVGRGGSALVVRKDRRCVVYAEGRLVTDVTVADETPNDWEDSVAVAGGRALLAVDNDRIVRAISGKEKDVVLGAHGARVARLVWTEEGILADSLSGMALLDPVDGHVKSPRKRGFEVSGTHLVVPEDLKMPESEDSTLSPDGSWFAAHDATGLLIRRADGSDEIRRFEIEPDRKGGREMSPRHVAFSSDGTLVAIVTGPNAFVDVWDAAAGRRVARLGPFDAPIEDLALVPAEKTLLVVTGDTDEAFLHRFALDGSPLGRVEWPNRNAEGLVVQGRWACSADYGGEDHPPALVLLDLRDPAATVRHTIPGAEGFSLLAVHEAADRDRILVEGLDGAGVFVASCSGGFLRRLLEDSYSEYAFSGFLDGVHPVTVSDEGLALWHGPTLERASLDAGKAGQALAVSPDGRRIAVAQKADVVVYELR